jgi:probable selenium-dependent hydroxylase accessory protein YqeC
MEAMGDGWLVLGSVLGQDGKVHGILPGTVCDLQRAGLIDLILCEADGAAGRSIKVHGSHEPLIPPCTHLVLVVAGLDALGQPALQANIHRFELFLECIQASEGDPIEPWHVAAALDRCAEHALPDVRRVFVLNKADDPRAVACGRMVLEALCSLSHTREITLTSRGNIVEFHADRSSEQLVSTVDP